MMSPASCAPSCKAAAPNPQPVCFATMQQNKRLLAPTAPHLLGPVHDFHELLLCVLEAPVQQGAGLPHQGHDHVVVQEAGGGTEPPQNRTNTPQQADLEGHALPSAESSGGTSGVGGEAATEETQPQRNGGTRRALPLRELAPPTLAPTAPASLGGGAPEGLHGPSQAAFVTPKLQEGPGCLSGPSLSAPRGLPARPQFPLQGGRHTLTPCLC